MSIAWLQYKAVVLKEVRQTARDKRVMFMLVAAPMVQLLALGFAVDFDVRHVPTAVVDHDDTRMSRDAVRGLFASDVLEDAGKLTDEASAERALETGKLAAAVIIPRGFAHDGLRGRPARIQLLLDGADPIRAGVAADTASRYFRQRGALPPIDRTLTALYNPGLVTQVFVVPGLLAMLLVIVTTIVMSMGLARERETGTLEQLQVTPIGSSVLMLGKMTPFAVAAFIDVGIGLSVGTWVFDVPLRGSLVVVALATALYLLSTLGMGLFIAAFSKTQQQAFLGGFLFMLPSALLSGALTPVSSMPDWLQAVTLVNPVRYFSDIMRAVLLKGAGLAELWLPLLMLGIFGSTVLAFATRRFRSMA